MAWMVLLASLMLATPAAGQSSRPNCGLPAPTVLRHDGNAILQVWEMTADPLWSSDVTPDAPGYAAFRDAIRAAGGDLRRPVADPVKVSADADREMWRREDLNAALMYDGVGVVRPIRCVEAALFALQDSRYSELARPTEFIAHVLRRDDRLKVYFGAGDTEFPPRQVYASGEVSADVAAGWEYLALLHNHTVRTLNGKPALGVPAPSTSDVDLLRRWAALGLREAWITNGLYTGVVRAADLPRFNSRD